MRILQINIVCGVGSTGRIATDIHNTLSENNHESYIAYGRDEPLNCNSAIRIGNNFEIYSHVIKTRIFDKHGFGSKRATKTFIKKIKELSPDVIHLHNIHGYYINVEMLFEYVKLNNIPVVWTLHDCWPFTGHCTNFEYTGCKCWKVDGNQKCIQKESYPTTLFFNNSRSNFKRKRKAFTGVKNLTICTPSNWLKDIVENSFLGEYPLEVINNGIDLDVFKPSKSDFRKKYNLENKFIILAVANTWNKRKGYNYILDLSNSLKENEKIIMVGLTKSQLLDLPDNIIGITRTKNTKELAEIYSAANVFINPTLEDNFPTTNLESLACGTPVITFKTGGSIESVDNKTGIIVEKGSLVGLRKAISSIKQDKSYYTKKCRQRAEQLYNKTDRYSEYIKLYKEIRK